MGKLGYFSRIKPHYMDLVGVISIGEKSDFTPIRGPNRRRIPPVAMGQLPDSLPFTIGYPQVACSAIIHLIHPTASEDDQSSLRRDVRAPDRLHLHVCFLIQQLVIFFRSNTPIYTHEKDQNQTKNH